MNPAFRDMAAIVSEHPMFAAFTEAHRELIAGCASNVRFDAGEIPFRALPGQFNMMYACGIGEAAISLSGDCDDAKRIRHTIRRIGAVTAGLCKLGKGDSVGIRGPFGRPWPLEAARGADIVVVAGGIGLAPLRPAIYELLTKREKTQRMVQRTNQTAH